MAIKFVGSVLGTPAAASGTLPITINGGDRLLTVGVSTRNTGGTVTNMTFAAQAMTRAVKATELVGELNSSEIWYLKNPPTGLGTILGTVSTGVSRYVAANFEGALIATDPLDATFAGTGNTGTTIGTVVTTQGLDVAIDMNTHEDANIQTAGTGITVLRNVDEGVWQQNAGYMIDTSGAGASKVFSWVAGAADNWNEAIAAFKVGTGIAFDSAGSAASGVGSNTLSWTHTCTGTSLCLIVTTHNLDGANAGTVTTITD